MGIVALYFPLFAPSSTSQKPLEEKSEPPSYSSPSSLKEFEILTSSVSSSLNSKNQTTSSKANNFSNDDLLKETQNLKDLDKLLNH